MQFNEPFVRRQIAVIVLNCKMRNCNEIRQSDALNRHMPFISSSALAPLNVSFALKMLNGLLFRFCRICNKKKAHTAQKKISNKTEKIK